MICRTKNKIKTKMIITTVKWMDNTKIIIKDNENMHVYVCCGVNCCCVYDNDLFMYYIEMEANK